MIVFDRCVDTTWYKGDMWTDWKL